MDARTAPLEDVKVIVNRLFFSGPYKRVSLHEDAMGLFVLLTLFQETGLHKYLDRVRLSMFSFFFFFRCYSPDLVEIASCFAFVLNAFCFHRFISSCTRVRLRKLRAKFVSRGLTNGTMPSGRFFRPMSGIAPLLTQVITGQSSHERSDFRELCDHGHPKGSPQVHAGGWNRQSSGVGRFGCEFGERSRLYSGERETQTFVFLTF